MAVMQKNNNNNLYLNQKNIKPAINMYKELPERRISGASQQNEFILQQKQRQENKPRRKRLESMSDDEIIEANLKELLEKKHHDDRQANGRRVAIVVAMLLIFMAVYHAWIRKSAMLAGALVPAFIMISYGAWVVILAKRDKEKRALFEKHVEEVAEKNKKVMKEKAKLKKRQEQKAKEQAAMLKMVNELKPALENKRPSFRQKFFRQNHPQTFSTAANIHQLATSSLFSPALAIGTGVHLKPHVQVLPLAPIHNAAKEKFNYEREFSSTATAETDLDLKVSETP